MFSQGIDPFVADLARQGATQDGTMVTFFAESAIDGIKSHEAGKPIYFKRDMVKIQHLGERDYITRPATFEDKARYKQQWDAYSAGGVQGVDGTPLSILFPANPEIIDNLKIGLVTTVEQLAALNDSQLQNIGMGALHWSRSAKQFLSAQDKGADYQKLQAQVDALVAAGAADKQRIAALEEALAEANSKDKGRTKAA